MSASPVRRMAIVGSALAAVLGVALWATVRLPPARAKRPSVVLISIDTVRPDHLGCYGYARATSPNLDRFAAGAALFLNARSQAPWTLPSHMSLLTSALPSHNGVEDIMCKLPDDVAYLPELLRGAGYRTAAFVNNAQMKPHWGFARGFEVWREFDVDTPEGMARPITDQAAQWLSSAGPEPFFLFLHYYDAHDPYDPPSPFRERFGVTLTGAQARELAWEYRTPDRPFPDPALLDRLRAAYDAEIAYLDEQLGRLFAAIPRDAWVVVFSDHGEAFKEHGWTLHGAELYEEEIRTVLMIREPSRAGGRRVDDPVMLLDVAPTLLAAAGIARPASFEGIELQPALAGQPLPPRLHFAETKSTLEGRVLKAVLAPPAKLIYSLPDDESACYELPDEHQQMPHIRARLKSAMREWADQDRFWLVHVKGKGRYELTADLTSGRFSVFVPIGLDLETEDIEVERSGLIWTCYPGGGSKRLFLQADPPDAELRISASRESGEAETNVFWRTAAGAWVPEAGLSSIRRRLESSPAFDRVPFRPGPDGLYVERHGTRPKAGRPGRPAQLDEKTLQQLRSLGYAR